MKSSHLAAHKQTHSEKRLICSFPNCNYSTTTRQHLKRHETLHVEPNPYQVLPTHLTNVNVSAPTFPPVPNHSGRNISFEHISQKSIHKLHHFHVPTPTKAVKLRLQFNLNLLFISRNVIQNATFVRTVMNRLFFFSIFNDIVVMTIVHDVSLVISNLLQEMH